jgi:hypothetical protein
MSVEPEVWLRAQEGIRFELFGFGIGSPEDDSNIETPRRRAIQDVQRRPPAVWHLEVCPHEGHRRPNALTGSFDGLTNAADAGSPSTSGRNAFPGRAGNDAV